MTAKDIMTTQVLTARPDMSLKDAMRLCVEICISGLVVADDDMSLVGVITEKDLLVAYDFLKETKSPIRDFIQKKVISVTEDTPVEEVSRILFANNIIRVPVINGNKVVGVVSRRDILRYILKNN